MKYVISKMKGAFYAGSEKIYAKGLKLKKYLSLTAVANMVKSLHLSVSSLIFKGVTKNEQNKIARAIKGRKPKPKPKAKKAKGKKRKK